MITCTKKYINFPFAHRQPNHEGHCRLIHGHNWAFEFVFACEKLDANGFVIDFGSLGWLKELLNDMFDHTLVLNFDDPYLEYLKLSLGDKPEVLPGGHSSNHVKVPFAKIKCVPNCGAEGLADWLAETVDNKLQAITEDRVFLMKVTVFEDDKNSATFHCATGGCDCA